MPSIGSSGRAQATKPRKSLVRTAEEAKKERVRLRVDRSFPSSGGKGRGCRRNYGLVLNGRIDRAIIIPAVRRSRTPIPIVDQQSQAQLRRLVFLPGTAIRFLRAFIEHNAVAQIAAKDGIVVGNRVE